MKTSARHNIYTWHINKYTTTGTVHRFTQQVLFTEFRLPQHPHTVTPSHPHRVSDASGSLDVTPVGKYPLTCEMLDTTVGVAVHMEMTSSSNVIMTSSSVGCLHPRHWCWWDLCLAGQWCHSTGEESSFQECCGTSVLDVTMLWCISDE